MTHEWSPAREEVGHDPVEAELSGDMKTVDSFSVQDLWTGSIAHQVNHHTEVTLSGVSERERERETEGREGEGEM